MGCTSESHPLYSKFMSLLSSSIFEWDGHDVTVLMKAKENELKKAGIPFPSDLACRNAISKEEFAKHCRRSTRGTQKTIDAIEALLLKFFPLTDAWGVPVLRQEMNDIWAEQRRHIRCLQDPPGIQLYVVTGHLTKGGVKLPILRCARGTTSLESFHNHLAKFIPGSSANGVNFQAYLLEGITRQVCLLIRKLQKYAPAFLYTYIGGMQLVQKLQLILRRAICVHLMCGYRTKPTDSINSYMAARYSLCSFLRVNIQEKPLAWIISTSNLVTA